MTLYVTPMSMNRMAARRRWMERMMDGDVYESEVVFPIDVKVEAEAFVISAMLPGIQPDDLSIQVVNETVTIQGEFKNTREENAEYLLSEMPSGKFSRVLTLPSELDASKAEANFENGVLTLRVPKAEAARPRTIKVVTK